MGRGLMAGSTGALSMVQFNVDFHTSRDRLGRKHVALALVVARSPGLFDHAICDRPPVEAGGVVANGLW